MTHFFTKPIVVPAALYFGTLLTILLALVQVVQIPLGALPEDSQRLSAAPARLNRCLSGVRGRIFLLGDSRRSTRRRPRSFARTGFGLCWGR